MLRLAVVSLFAVACGNATGTVVGDPPEEGGAEGAGEVVGPERTKCGWPKATGQLTSTGHDEGDVIANVRLVDQCEDKVRLHDFAGEYHILFMTAAW